ncbi:carbonic anhydrase [Paxillus ammoniavirescens]|nr:carbonic anhydrase [Paxillus ammoniavirescens]
MEVVLDKYIYSPPFGLNLKVLEHIKIYSPIAHYLPAEAHYHEPPPVPSRGCGKICLHNPCIQRTWAQRMTQAFPQYFPDRDAGQHPKILWIGCSDSRIQESDATTSLPGNVFVHRNIANQFHLDDDNALSVLSYGVGELGAQHVVIVGHRNCGGAHAALDAAREPKRAPHHHTTDNLGPKDPNDALTTWLTPLIDRVKQLALPENADAALDIVVEENVKLQVNNLTKLESFFKKSAKGPVWVHGWVFDFSTGFLRDLKITQVLGAK